MSQNLHDDDDYEELEDSGISENLHGGNDDDEEVEDSDIRCELCVEIIYLNKNNVNLMEWIDRTVDSAVHIWICEKCFCFKCERNKYDNVKVNLNLTKYKDHYWCDSCLVGDKSKDKLEKFGGEMVKKS